MIFANFVVTCSWCACFRYTRRMEKDEALIEAVRDYQCLYNSKSADFKVVLKKENERNLHCSVNWARVT